MTDRHHSVWTSDTIEPDKETDNRMRLICSDMWSSYLSVFLNVVPCYWLTASGERDVFIVSLEVPACRWKSGDELNSREAAALNSESVMTLSYLHKFHKHHLHHTSMAGKNEITYGGYIEIMFSHIWLKSLVELWYHLQKPRTPQRPLWLLLLTTMVIIRKHIDMQIQVNVFKNT